MIVRFLLTLNIHFAAHPQENGLEVISTERRKDLRNIWNVI